MPTGLVFVTAVVMAPAVPCTRLGPSLPDASRRARSLARRLRMRQR